YLLLDRPVIRIHVPELIAHANIHPDYVRLLAEVADSVHDIDETIDAVEDALADPSQHSKSRRAVASDLFHAPGSPSERCAAALYEAIELEAPAVSQALPVSRENDGENDAVLLTSHF